VGTAVASSDQVSIRNLKRLAGAGLVLAAVGVMSAQPALAGKTGAAFGIAFDEPKDGAVNFAAVNDTLNTVIVFDLSDK
jgi:hypothetical protein